MEKLFTTKIAALMPWLIAIATVVLHLVCIDRYGYFRDELYYLACADHLDWGYVDQSPLIALVAFVVRRTIGDSLLAIRLLPALAGGGIVLLTATIARQLGGKRYAQSLAALMAMVAPVYLATGHFLSMNAFEPLFWMGAVSIALSIFNGASPKRWLLFGVLAGLGLQNKHATLFFGLAFFAALVMTEQRRHLRDVWIWLGGIVAFLIFLPNLIWQIQHDFATVELLRGVAQSNKNAPVTPVSFITGQFMLMNPITAPLWMVGLVWLFRSARYRTLAWCFVLLAIEFILLKGKIYYLSPAFPMVLAAGGVATSRARPRLRAAAAGAVILAGALLAPLTLPILPVSAFIRYQKALGLEAPATENHEQGPLPQLYADMYGWPEMTAVVARAYGALTPAERAKCAIFAQNYGQAGAIDLFGKRYGLPKAISGHQNYYLWGPRGYTGEIMIVLDDERETLETLFETVEEVGVVDHPLAMPYERRRPVHLCRGMKVPLAELWPKIKKWI